MPGPTLTRGRRNFALYLTRGTPISVPRISTHFSLARLLREHSHHDTALHRFKGNDTMITASRRQTTLVGVNPLTSILDWAKKRLRPG